MRQAKCDRLKLIYDHPDAEIYYVYIVSNKSREVIYTGVTTDWQESIEEHRRDARGNKGTYPGKHGCEWLVLLEEYYTLLDAIRRERQIKGWVRSRKNELISSVNPNWTFLNKRKRRSS